MSQFKYEKPRVISEIGCNHMGQMDVAFELIQLSKACGADIAKFQKRNIHELLSNEQYNAPHPHPWNSYGANYGEHRKFLEFTVDQHADLKKHAEKVGIVYSSSVWDVTSANEIISLDPIMIKVPSACNNHFELLKLLRDEYSGDVHVSTGMSTRQEVEDMVAFFEETGQAKDRLVVYSCTSGYPVPFPDVCLLEITYLREHYSDRIKDIGFSGHHNGIAIDIAAYTLGAVWVERHFTKDRTLKGTDHAASLEIPGMQKLVRDLHHTYISMSYKKEEILDIEKEQRHKLKYRHAEAH